LKFLNICNFPKTAEFCHRVYLKILMTFIIF
jgi:hypothetical protein